jgi:hypothetical protein
VPAEGSQRIFWDRMELYGMKHHRRTIEIFLCGMGMVEEKGKYVLIREMSCVVLK